jgi:hypothetical protein
MRTFVLAIMLAALSAAAASAQSLNINSPAPLKAGVNASNTDNFTGTHYWYFYANPGHVVVATTFKGGTVLGAPTNATLTFTLSDSAASWHITKVLTGAAPNHSFDGSFKKRTKVIVTVAPISGGLVREGGDYTIAVSGAVAYGEEKSGDPIVGTYTQMAGMTSNYGACKFKADGTILASTGATGTWKLFDADSHTYVIVLDGQRLSLTLRPGRGLTDPSDPSAVDFQAVR